MKIKTFTLALIALFCLYSPIARAVDENGKYTFLLTGASFAIPQNGWFEIGCRNLDATAINKSVSGEAIYHTARRMNAGTFYTLSELDATDVFVIGHVHNQNVANEEWLKDNWQDYADIATTTNYATTYDYVIKRYIYDCEQLEFNPDSKYYGVEGGKPAKIMLCTHWHDSRTTYNPAIRKLAQKWNFPLVEFDTNIGFSKDDVDPADEQPSLAMAHDTETINGVKYGWHPLRGDNSPIQRRMADIFVKTMAEFLDIDCPFEVGLYPVSPLYLRGEDVRVGIDFKGGMFPYDVDFTAGYQAINLTGLEGINHVMTYAADENAMTFFLNSASDSSAKDSSLGEEVGFVMADLKIDPDYDSYIHEAFKENNYDSGEVLELKNGDNYSRKIYISFPTEEIPEVFSKLAVRLYFNDYVLGTFNNENRPMDGIEPLNIEGNTNVYSGIKWSTHYNHVFEPIASTKLTTGMKDGWIGWDVTEWATEKLQNEGVKHLTFRITTDPAWASLMRFVSTDNAQGASVGPQLLVATQVVTGVESAEVSSGIQINGSRIYNPDCELISVTGTDGKIYLIGKADSYDLSSFQPGVYIVKSGSFSRKILL